MSISKEAIRHAQQSLGFTGRDVDGIVGTNTERALTRELHRKESSLSARHAAAILQGSRTRKVTAYIQLLASEQGIDVGEIDGFWGPQSDFAFEALQRLEAGDGSSLRPEPTPGVETPPNSANPNGWPMENETELTEFYGEPGDESNLSRIEVPFPHKLSWALETSVSRIRVHRKVADSYQRVLEKALDHYGLDRIEGLRLDRWGGSFNKRRKRGGTSWSTHAWGIALDYDPERNQLRWGRDRAAFAKSEYDAWWGLWEEEGWLSLGRFANFDWMHVQAARRP